MDVEYTCLRTIQVHDFHHHRDCNDLHSWEISICSSRTITEGSNVNLELFSSEGNSRRLGQASASVSIQSRFNGGTRFTANTCDIINVNLRQTTLRGFRLRLLGDRLNRNWGVRSIKFRLIEEGQNREYFYLCNGVCNIVQTSFIQHVFNHDYDDDDDDDDRRRNHFSRH